MTKQKLMPGTMSESPTTGEPQAQIKTKNPIGTQEKKNLNQNLILAPQNTEARAITQSRQSTLAELDTLGARTHIPSGHIVNTL